MGYTILQILLIVLFPALSIWLVQRLRIGSWLSPVVLCYGIGITMANVGNFPIQTDISTQFSEVTILFAIPLLLYATDIPAWLKYARTTLLSFALCVLAAIIASVGMALVYQSYFEQTPRYAGMMLGLFTGGAPNMQAVGMMLEAKSEDFVLLNAADIFIGGCYLLFLTSVAHRFFGRFLPNFQAEQYHSTEEIAERKPSLVSYLSAFVLTILVVAAAVGLTLLLTGALNSVVLIILLLTTFAIGLSFVPKIRQLGGSFQLGEYFLLMFCVAIGLLADFTSIWEKGGMVILYMASVWLSIAFLHTLGAYFFRIDRDTLMVTATACIYGPVFVGQVASAIGNRTLVFSGIATGLVGYALGNYLGLGLAYLLEWYFTGGG
ncbi:MAG: DUF819 family protein [Bacteroidota bacterium]